MTILFMQSSAVRNALTFISETKQHLPKRMAQHQAASSSGQESTVHLHVEQKGYSFEDENVHVLDKEDRCFERGVKEAISVKLDQTSPKRGGSPRH